MFSFFKRTSVMLLMVVFVCSCASKESELKAKKARIYLGAGTQSLMAKDYTDALRNLIEADRLEPKNPDILNNLAMAYYFKGEKETAIKHLKQALEIDNKHSDARMNLASIYYYDKNYDGAEELYKLVTRDLTYEKQARTYYNLGILELEARRDRVAAENYFRKSIKEDDNYCPSYFQLGLIQYKRKFFTSALKNFKEASLGSCYETPAPHFYQALALIDLGKYIEARVKLDEIENRFKKTDFAVKARTKLLEIDGLENKKNFEPMASRKVLESPDF